MSLQTLNSGFNFKLSPIMLGMFAVLNTSIAFAETQLNTIVIEDNRHTKESNVEIGASTHYVLDESHSGDDSASLGDVLSVLPGVNNQSSGAQTGRPVVRGVTGERLNIMQDGEPTDYQAYGARHQTTIEPLFVEKITLLRGSDALKLSGQSVAGVVRADSLSIPYRDQDVKQKVATEYNTNNQEYLLGAQVKGTKKGFGWVLAASRRAGDNFVTPKGRTAGEVTPQDSARSLPLVTGETPYTDFETQSYLAGLGYEAQWGKVELKHQYWQTKQNYLGVEAEAADEPFELIPSAGQELTNQTTSLQAEIYTDSDWVFKPSYQYLKNQRLATHEIVYQDMASVSGDELLDILVERQDLKLAAETPEFAGWLGEIGVAGYQKQQTLNSGHLVPSADEQAQSLYWTQKKQAGKWQYELGARYDHQSLKLPLDGENEHFVDEVGVLSATNNEKTDAGWSGALGAAYQLSSQWKTSLQLNRSFRAPSIYERYAGGMHGGVQAFELGNPDLEAETGFNTELGLSYQTKLLSMSASVYRNAFDNYISLQNTGYYRYIEGHPLEGQQVATAEPGTIPEMSNQQSKATIQGMELYAKYKPNQNWQWTATGEVIQGYDLDNHRDLPLIPANNATLEGRYLWAQHFVSVDTKYVAAKERAGLYEPFSQFDDFPFGTASTEDYWLWNAQAGTDVKWAKSIWHASLKIENLFDTAYRDYMDTYKGYAQGMGRNYKLNVSVDF